MSVQESRLYKNTLVACFTSVNREEEPNEK